MIEMIMGLSVKIQRKCDNEGLKWVNFNLDLWKKYKSKVDKIKPSI